MSVKDARSPQNAAHFGSPAPRSAARAAPVSLTAVSPADLQGLSSIKRIAVMEDTMSQSQHDHAAFDRFPELVGDLTAEFGSDGIDAIVETFIAAEQADFCWEGRFAERNLGVFESLDDEEEERERVAVLGYFRAQYYVATCVVDEERHVRALLNVRQFDNFGNAQRALLAGT
jgi:hypothetical protein